MRSENEHKCGNIRIARRETDIVIAWTLVTRGNIELHRLTYLPLFCDISDYNGCIPMNAIKWWDQAVKMVLATGRDWTQASGKLDEVHVEMYRSSKGSRLCKVTSLSWTVRKVRAVAEAGGGGEAGGGDLGVEPLLEFRQNKWAGLG